MKHEYIELLIVIRDVSDVTTDFSSEFVVEVADIDGRISGSSLGSNVSDVADASGTGITESGVHDGTSSELEGFIVSHLWLVMSVQDTIGVQRTRTDGADTLVETLPVVVNVEDSRSSLVVSSNHGTLKTI